MFNPLFSYYPGAIKLSKCSGYVSLRQFVDSHKNPKPNIRKMMHEISECTKLGEKGKKKKKELKKNLYSFTPSVLIKKGDKRRYSNIHNWTGLMQLDFDGITDEYILCDLKNHIFNEYKSVCCAYYSPSRNGFKGLMRIKKPESIEDYKNIHRAVAAEMEQYSYFDNATFNGILPLFISFDEDILYRDVTINEQWSDVIKETAKEDYKNVTEKVSLVNFHNFSADKKRTIEIFERKINSIISNGHPQLRNACLTLGSRSGAGYIDIYYAKQLAESLIKNNSYLGKDIENYIKTAFWAIEQGFNNPIYYKT